MHTNVKHKLDDDGADDRKAEDLVVEIYDGEKRCKRPQQHIESGNKLPKLVLKMAHPGFQFHDREKHDKSTDDNHIVWATNTTRTTDMQN